MKETIYEQAERKTGVDHCDRPTTVTGVTVLSNQGEKLRMLINRYFEHCGR
jgi:hypothetical protein